MIKITITSIKVDSSFVEEHTEFKVGDVAYYVIRENGMCISPKFKEYQYAVLHAWQLVCKYGLTLVEPW